MTEKTFERIVEFTPAFDKRSTNPKKDYGIGSMQIRFVLKGKYGAVQFLCGTNIYLPETIEEYKTKGVNGRRVNLLDDVNDGSGLRGWDLGYHSPRPTYEGQTIMDENCKYTGGKCYYDGSGLNAIPFVDVLIREGSEGIWKKLEEYYYQVFEVSQ